MTCPACGRENDTAAWFCAGCGANLVSAGVAAETRKVVTVFFIDLTESTALGERLDPELLRRVKWRYFDVVQGVLERHRREVRRRRGGAPSGRVRQSAYHDAQSGSSPSVMR